MLPTENLIKRQFQNNYWCIKTKKVLKEKEILKVDELELNKVNEWESLEIKWRKSMFTEKRWNIINKGSKE